jgi:AMIN domain
MPNFRYFGALLALAAALSSPISAQSSPPKSQTTRAQVQHVVVRGTGDAIEVEIQTSGAPLAPDTQAITGPDRIVVDFPGALPAAELRALKVNSGPLKGVRAGLFFSNPPITRVVLDLAEPHSYQVSTAQISKKQNVVVVKLTGKLSAAQVGASQISAASSHPARLQNASLASGALGANANASVARMAPAVANPPMAHPAAVASSTSESPAPPKPSVAVGFSNGMLSIRADKATLAQVLFEVQRQTQAEIAIPAGAEQEQVVVDLGPAPARDVLGSLLNGSPYNFIFVGSELNLEKVILTRRDSSLF